MTGIAVVGTEAFILGFRLAGIDHVFPADTGSIEETLRQVMRDDRFGILVVHEEEVAGVSEPMKETMLRNIRPVFIKIGGTEEELRNKIKAIIGVDLYKSNPNN